MPIAQFKAAATRPATAARPAAAARAPVGSRYAGISAEQPRDPMPTEGIYRFRVTRCEESMHPQKRTESFKLYLEVVDIAEGGEGFAVGDIAFVVQRISGEGSLQGLGRVKAFAVAAAGYETEAEYDAMDPEGLLIAATVGHRNAFSEKKLTLIGRLVDCQVRKGKVREDGEYYREYTWAPVPDAEQDK